MSLTWGDWGDKMSSPFNPESAIQAQAKYMAWLLKDQKDLEWALAAYNYGIGRVKKLRAAKHGTFYELSSELPDETIQYVDRIMNFHQEYSHANIPL